MPKAKIVSLLAFRNEEKFLPLHLQSLRGIVDMMLGYDDASNHNSRSIFQSHGGILVKQLDPLQKSGIGATKKIRDHLLHEGRRQGGTHFIILDADEFLIGVDPLSVRERILQLSPSQKLLCDWVMLSSNCRGYRNENSIWKPQPKDFIFADRSDLSYPDNTFVHFARTPQYQGESFLHHTNFPDLKVIHLQFANWHLGQIKQCWYRFHESVINGKTHESINHKYAFVKEQESDANVSPLDKPNLTMISKLNFTPIISAKLEMSWYYSEIRNFINFFPRYRYQNLDVWYIDEIASLYKDKFGKLPRYSRISKFKNRVYWRKVHASFMLRQFINKRLRVTRLR